jgi:hypothetical protein
MNVGALLLRSSVVAFLAATGACSLAVGFDGFAGPARVALDDGGDASPDADRAPADGGVSNVDASDGPAPEVDAGDPNTPPVFVDGGSFCGAQDGATFCEDFDTADLPVHWIHEGVFARLTSYTPKSSPNGLLLDAPETATGGTFVSKISRTFDAPSTNLVVAFDFQPERVNLGSSFLIVGALEYTMNDSKYSIRLVYSNGSVRLEESNLVPPPNNKDAYHPFFAIPTGKWTRVKLDIVASGATPGVVVSLDGVAVGPREVLTPTVGLDPTPTLILGAVFGGNPHTGWTLRYDDVTVTYR